MTLVSNPSPIDNTLNQTVGEQMRAEELSLRATVPPAQVPGYRLDRLLGQGAFGQVWVGNNLNTGRTVAIKFYLHRSGVNWSLLTREVKNLVSMAGNRFIVQVLEVGWDSEPPFYVMEYLENGSLDDLIRARGAMSPSRAMELFSDIAIGLNHSHGKGVLHCDLKPANVLLDQDLLPRLADFGQSRLSTEQTPSLGTLFYMAPEQADLNAVPDARWDVYALGAILYCMIVGSPPYRTPDTVATLDTAASLPERLKRYRDTIFKSHFPRAHHRVRGMDRSLIAIIDRCIAKKPEDRFANVQQVLAAIERRQMASLRRPLMLLGIVGPILLLAVMGLFSWRAVSLAQRESSDDLRDGVLERNQWMARTAAQKVELEMAELFRLIEKEANRGDMETGFLSCVDEAGNELLHSLATDKPSQENLAALLPLESRTRLDAYLKERLVQISQSSDEKKPARFDSLFVTDRYGTMLAAAFSSDQPTKIGMNFAFRSYFSGQTQDSVERTPRRNIARSEFTHVSTPFRSTTTNRWKIAVSTPISIVREFDGEESIESLRKIEQDPGQASDSDTLQNTENDNQSARAAAAKTEAAIPQQIEGLLVLTINLGDFVLLAEDGRDRFAILVDCHEGIREGHETSGATILQHPILSQISGINGINEVSPYLIDEDSLRIDEETLKSLKEKGTFDYVDPTSNHARGKAFGGKWIAAMEQVDVSRRVSDTQERRQSTELWVLVQERADSVTAPVASMVSKLVREGMIALLTLLSVISVLWVVVLWVMRLPDSFAAAVRARTIAGKEKTGTANDATLDLEQ